MRQMEIAVSNFTQISNEVVSKNINSHNIAEHNEDKSCNVQSLGGKRSKQNGKLRPPQQTVSKSGSTFQYVEGIGDDSKTKQVIDKKGLSTIKKASGSKEVESGKTKSDKGKNSIKCNRCEKLFQYRSEFDVHYQISYNRLPVYTCPYCNETIEKYSTFRSHCYRHSTEGRFKCTECPQTFCLQSMLQVHVLVKHSNEKPHSCEECNKSFATKQGLKLHTKKHQLEMKEDFPCVECGKILHTRGGLTSHMNVHRLGRRFMCDLCGQTFTQKINMQQHVKQHIGDKPYECDKCSKTFTERSHLSRHYRFHSNDRPHKCEICGKTYKTERCLKVHRMVHGKDRPYTCTYCNKGFLSSTKLKQHYNIHTGERPFACKYCERTFTNYPNWLKHTRRRHSVISKADEQLPAKKEAEEEEPHKTAIKNSNDVKIEIKSEMQSDLRLDDMDMDSLPHLGNIESPEAIHHDSLTTDFKLSKMDELYLKQKIVNFPITDESMSFMDEIALLNEQSSSEIDLVPLHFL